LSRKSLTNGKRGTLRKQTTIKEEKLSDAGSASESGEDWVGGSGGAVKDVFKDLISQVNKINDIIEDPASPAKESTPLK